MRELVDYDPLTGTSCYLEYTEGTKFRIVHETDSRFTRAILDNNARLRNDTDRKKKGIKKGFMHAADITPSEQIKWLVEEGIDVLNPDHWPRVREKLNSPDYAYLKAIDGRV